MSAVVTDPFPPVWRLVWVAARGAGAPVMSEQQEAEHWAGLPTMPDAERPVDVDDEDEERER